MNYLKPKGIIIIAHTVHCSITKEQCIDSDGFPIEWKELDIHFIEIQPLVVGLNELNPLTLNWEEIRIIQEDLYKQKIVPFLKVLPSYTIIYIGFAPIPLMIHLGSLIGNSTEVYVMMKDHKTHKRWYFEKRISEISSPPIVKKGLPSENDDFNMQKGGDIGLCMSISRQVNGEETKTVMKNVVRLVYLGVENPDYDIFPTQKELRSIANEFDSFLAKIKYHYPNIDKVHLFASIPIEVAFIIGTKIRPNIHQTIQTYQYKSNLIPSYAPAIVVNQSLVKELDKGKIKALLKKGRNECREAINLFLDYAKDVNNTNLENSLIIQYARFEDYKDTLINIGNNETQELNQIRYSILSLLDDIK